jgi:hypothetical protein
MVEQLNQAETDPSAQNCPLVNKGIHLAPFRPNNLSNIQELMDPFVTSDFQNYKIINLYF